MLTVTIPDHLERYLREAVAEGRFASIDQAVTLAVGRLEYDDVIRQRPTAPPLPANYKPIWEIAQEIAASIPDEEWAKLPTDGAEQHDHYIYGTPKRPPSP
jgi:Arc/MetJ-type ribon-helix-helix transcriptional regulator